MTKDPPSESGNDAIATPPAKLVEVFSEGAETGAHTVTGGEKTFRVLVVDDNPLDQELAAMALGQAWPFERVLELDFAAEGEEALAKLHKKRFALVVLDWKLPLMGEGKVLQHLRQDGIRIPVVVISNEEREGIDADLDALKAAFLNKNQMDPKTFLFAISRALALLGITPAAANLQAKLDTRVVGVVR